MRSARLLLILPALLFCFNLQAQSPKLYGLTPSGGGPNGYGTLFSLYGDGSNFNVEHTFSTTYTGSQPYGQPLWANDNKIYGTTTGGGGPQQGVIFSYDPATQVYSNLFEFHDTLGRYPTSTLVQASDGLLYGTTYGYGYFDYDLHGTLFSFNPVNSVYKMLALLPISSGGLVQGPGGKLYGVADSMIFSWNIQTQAFKKEYVFPDTMSASTTGALALSPYDSLLYGGAWGYSGTYIYNFNPTSGVIKIIGGSATATDGSIQHFGTPFNDMIIANDSMIYGCSSMENNYQYFYSCNTRTRAVKGIEEIGEYYYNPSLAGVAMGSGNNIYCMTEGMGILVYNTQQKSVRNLFNPTECDFFSGGKPCVSPGGRIYSFSSSGGNCSALAEGFMFSFAQDSSQYTKDFVFNVSNGCRPDGSLTLADGKLFGACVGGGSNNLGCIFSYNPQNGVYSVLHNFDTTGAPNSSGGFGNDMNLTLAPNGKLYGALDGGGLYVPIYGCIYSIDPVTNIYSRLYGCDTGKISTGLGNLTLMPDGNLYGIGTIEITTYPNIQPCIYSFNPATAAVTLIDTFPIAATMYYQFLNAPAAGSNGHIYAMNNSYIFDYNPATKKISVIDTFNTGNNAGDGPFGNLVMGADSMLYGLTSGESGGCGTFFKLNTTSNAIDVLHFFGGDTLASCGPASSVLQASDGNFYGTVNHGGYTLGLCSGGLVFKYAPQSNSFSYLHAFNYNDGITPQCALTQAQAGGCQPVYSSLSKIICAGDTVYVGDSTYTVSGIYNDTLSTAGCDSIVTLNLTVSNPFYDTISNAICFGDTFIFGNKAYAASGYYNDTLQTVSGCDSIITLALTVKKMTGSIGAYCNTACLWIGTFTAEFSSPVDSFYWAIDDTIFYNLDTLVIGVDSNYGVPAQLYVLPFNAYPLCLTAFSQCNSNTICDTISIIVESIPFTAANNQISVYPNPSTDHLLIKTQGMQPVTSVIYDLEGRVISTMPFKATVDVSKLTGGVYVLELQSENTRGRTRFVKM